jgi:hypothetical protein
MTLLSIFKDIEDIVVIFKQFHRIDYMISGYTAILSLFLNIVP